MRHLRKFDYLQLAVAFTGLIIFIVLAIGYVNDFGYIHWLDQFGFRYLREPLTPERSWFFRNITRAGNTKWTALVMVVTTIIALLIRKVDVAVFMMVNVGVFGLGVMSLFKHIFHRPRPAIYHVIEQSGYSFPSGHALNAILLYGSLIVLVHYYLKSEDNLRYAFMTLLSGLVIAIPVSRVYLGVHYFSDVLAGFGLGTFLLIMSKEVIFKYRTREVFENALNPKSSSNITQ
ncbi:phosphatase PAP2 family protein [Weissella paramesenteroides]|jgi:undecaprenyl-diphosphatase|uniref:PAP2 family protein n=2 Tax=Weissella paramesenteroides TaxID=1249 RepID=C5RB09_WEIPA|nr:phosphatase PAP2 family protein [Weissella paramesenteroides]ATF41812.1 phosphatase PAP2 family protein [Weissella paramesenteroides]EER74678.1 PAP2 family protein [Weissella paramesenteroides ATCC 33313]KAA8439611.1 phosphatase PAP2 family protein [Weissella paramesenteroides]KAA8441719.1 phosphatase PAP2 family protein [Weissella paramesenteroides]KAA8444732.1 phosphatase PAP2 family protein [Weissella paramesenteroides]